MDTITEETVEALPSHHEDSKIMAEEESAQLTTIVVIDNSSSICMTSERERRGKSHDIAYISSVSCPRNFSVQDKAPPPIDHRYSVTTPSIPPHATGKRGKKQ